MRLDVLRGCRRWSCARETREALNRRGFIYLVSLLFTLFLTIASASMLLRAMSETSLSERSRSQAEALHLADAAVDQAAINLRTPTDTTDDVTALTLPTGSFQIDAPPTSIAALTWKVTTHGVSAKDPSHPANIEAVFVLTPQSVFQFAMFGSQQVNVSGSTTTDSFNSANGPYNNTPGPGYNAGHHGDVGTNGTTPGGVTVSGSIFVDGQVAVGPNVADPTSVVTGYNPSFITGNPKVASQSSPFPLPAVTVPSGLTCSDYTVGGNSTITLAPGTYCYSSLTLQGGGTLTASGPVTIYLTGALVAKGNSSVGVVSDPTKMMFLMASGGAATLEQGTITGSTNFYGGLYGPDATINITGNAAVYGSIVANRVNLTGSAEIHYDQALTNNTQVSNLYKTSLKYWRKL